MISHDELKTNAETRLEDAKVLFSKERYDGSIYLCGYAVELFLKALICKFLGLQGIPNTSDEFKLVIDTIKGLKTHDLTALLILTDSLSEDEIITEIRGTYTTDWNTVLNWDPEVRYTPILGEIKKPEAKDLIESAEIILECLGEYLT